MLETDSIPVLGYRTDAFPGFYRRDSGHPVGWRVESAAQAAAVWRAHRALGARSGVVLAQPVAAADELDADLHDRLLYDGLALRRARRRDRQGRHPRAAGALPPASGGASLRANLALVLANARLAAEVAAALSQPSISQPSITGWSRCSSWGRSPR